MVDLPDELVKQITKMHSDREHLGGYFQPTAWDGARAALAYREHEVRELELEIEELRKETSGDDLHERPEWQAHPKALPGLPLSWRPKGERGAELLKEEEGKG